MGRALSLLAILLGAASCTAEASDDRTQDNLLILELGGDGVPVARVLRSRAADPVAPPAQRNGKPPANFWRGRTLVYRSVTLGQRTLSALCSEELGEAGRWREVMKLNGWDEAAVRRLPPDTRVKIPNE